MASCSSSSAPVKLQHDVFLSFRGEDTRHNFTSHLYAALSRKKIGTFIDDELRRGDGISPALVEAIETSKISVVIFSENYASSRWCLKELVKILERKSSSGQIVIPVFYRVDPSHVRNQTEAFGNAFAKLEERYQGEVQMLGEWRNALKEAANLSGFDSNVIKPESKLVEDIVKYILKRLNEESPLVDNKKLVGIESRIEYIEQLLCIGFSGVRKLGIWGIGGIGKTTLTDAVFKQIFRRFEGCCFFRNIREESEKDKELTSLHQQLVSEILSDNHQNLRFTFTIERLRHMKVLMIFDDVTNSKQIESLIGDPDCLGQGSRIIITTRDKKVLENCMVDDIYETKGLSDDAALQLFSQHAFRQSLPREDFMQLSSSVLESIKGVPLALEVIGSFLFNRTKQEWASAIQRLKRIPDEEIQKVLKVSYDGLNDEEQSIFLDIACFFKCWRRDHVIEFLDPCGYETYIGLQVLLEKSLITISSDIISMHDLLQEMGREIVRQESINDPGKRSRLFHHEDIYSVLSKNTGTGAILGIQLDTSQIRELHLNPKAFSRMYNLRFLKVYNSGFRCFGKMCGSEVKHDDKVHGFEVVESDFRELRYFCWHGYSAKSLPPNFQPNKLVALYMQCSKVKELLLGIRNLDNLKHINLGNSKHLRRILDFSRAPNLESLILEDCTSLVVSLSSFRILNKLVILNLEGCKSINTSLRSGMHWKFLRVLTLSNQSNLEMVPYIPCSVEELCLSETAIEELPSIEHPSRLVTLTLQGCSRLKGLSNDISKLESLMDLNLCRCTNLKMVPKISSKRMTFLLLDRTAIKELPSIEHPSSLLSLSLSHCSRLESLPEYIDQFKSLGSLDLCGCSKLDRLPNSLGNLENLSFLGFRITAIKEVQSFIASLKKLDELHVSAGEIRELARIPLPAHTLGMQDLSYLCINELLNNIWQLNSLQNLDLRENNFESLPASIKDLCKLTTLGLKDCKRLQSLPKLPDTLRRMDADGCTSLEALSGLPKGCLSMQDWDEFKFGNCLKLNFKAVMTDALSRIQRNANIWFRSSVPKAEMLGDVPPNGYICFPGNEVPEWFSCKTSGSCVELPAGWLKDNLVGFALCFVVSPNSNLNNHFIQSVNFHLSINNVKISVGKFYIFVEIDLLKSNHIFIGYDCGIMKTDQLHTVSSNSDGFIQLEIDSFPNKTKEYVKVKQWGVRLLYTEYYLIPYVDAKRNIDQSLNTMKPFVRRCEGCLMCCKDCSRTDGKTDNGKSIEFPHPEVYKRLLSTRILMI